MPQSEKTLSVFVDESGSFDSSCEPSRFYVITCVFHDQSCSLTVPLARLEEQLAYLRIPEMCFHAGPLIRREDEWRTLDIVMRRKIFSRMIAFSRACSISYHAFAIDKKFFSTPEAMQAELTRQIRDYLAAKDCELLAYDAVKVYYDNGQAQVKSILKSAFGSLNIVFPSQVTPERYRLFQVADLICTIELIRMKLAVGLTLTRSEDFFFDGIRAFKKTVLKPLSRLQK